MKIKNKKTGKILDVYKGRLFIHYNNGRNTKLFKSLDELKDWEEVEEVEEPKDFWFIDSGGEVVETIYITDYDKTNLRKFGNYFETKEEAEKAVEKLKAWKRLKDKGFKFEWWLSEPSGDHIEFYMDSFEWDSEATKDLDLLFGSGDLEVKNEH